MNHTSTVVMIEPEQHSHYSSLPLRFWNKIEVDSTNGCWVWIGSKNRRAPYGRFMLKGKAELAHRVAYEVLKEPIPEGLTIDHLCHNPSCVNPAHLEAVTQKENVLRGNTYGARAIRTNHCIHGHELTPDNVYIYGNGRWCRQCKIDQAKTKPKTEKYIAWRKAFNKSEQARQHNREYMREYRKRKALAKVQT